MRDALFANPYQEIWGASGSRRWPSANPRCQASCAASCPFGRRHIFRQASERAGRLARGLGPDGKGFRRRIHPNGFCLTGLREITEEKPLFPAISGAAAARSSSGAFPRAPKQGAAKCGQWRLRANYFRPSRSHRAAAHSQFLCDG